MYYIIFCILYITKLSLGTVISLMPRVFIIVSHGSMPVVDDPTSVALPVMGKTIKSKKAVSFRTPVDVFTTARFAQPYCADFRHEDQYVALTRNLSSLRLPPELPKADFRRIVKRELVEIRDQPKYLVSRSISETRIKCHKPHRPMTELFLFDSELATSIHEKLIMVDTETGAIRDVHTDFQLKLVKKRNTASCPEARVDDDVGSIFAELRESLARDVDALKASHADKFFIDAKADHCVAVDDTISGTLKGSKFEYSAKMKKRYGHRIKLSNLLHYGIETGVINPETDIVVVYACRVPDERGAVCGATSDRDQSDSERSVGGGPNGLGPPCKKTKNKKTKTKKYKTRCRRRHDR